MDTSSSSLLAAASSPAPWEGIAAAATAAGAGGGGGALRFSTGTETSLGGVGSGSMAFISPVPLLGAVSELWASPVKAGWAAPLAGTPTLPAEDRLATRTIRTRFHVVGKRGSRAP